MWLVPVTHGQAGPAAGVQGGGTGFTWTTRNGGAVTISGHVYDGRGASGGCARRLDRPGVGPPHVRHQRRRVDVPDEYPPLAASPAGVPGQPAAGIVPYLDGQGLGGST